MNVEPSRRPNHLLQCGRIEETEMAFATHTNTIHEFPLIEVSGTGYEMGYQHGAQAKNLVDRYLLWIERLTSKSRDVLARNAMEFLPHIEALSPPMIDEIRGLAAGAEVSFEEAVLCQARAEAAQVPEGGCTAFALTGDSTADGNPLAGQNQDLEPEYADVAILLRVNPTDGRPRALMFTFAGQLGFSGMNEHGVANFTNALYGCDWQLGLPHYPQKRVMLEQRTVADCVDVLRANQACSARNMVMADGQGTIADMEIRPGNISEFADDADGWRIHTNHYLTDEFKGFEDNTLPDSPSRFDRMRSLLKERWGEISVDHLKEFLADHDGDPAGICRHGADAMHSISGYIAEPAERVLHVRRGHGCLGSWRAYEV